MDSKKFKIFVIACLVVFAGLIIGIIILSQPTKPKETPQATTAAATEAATEATTEAVSEDTEEATTETATGAATETATEASAGEASEQSEVVLNDNTKTQDIIGSQDAETQIKYRSITFTLPKNWLGITAPDQNKCYFFYTEHATLMLNRQPLSGANLDSEEGVQGAMQGIAEGGFSNVQRDRIVTIGNYTGYVFTGEAEKDGVKYNGHVLYVQIGKEVYTFIIAAEDGYSYNEDIESIIGSIDIR